MCSAWSNGPNLDLRDVGGIGADDELSSRQREISSLVWNLGYFDTPARTGLETLAELTGLSQNTVSQHPRRGCAGSCGRPSRNETGQWDRDASPGAHMPG